MSKAGKDRNRARQIVEQQKARERRRKVTLWTSVAVVFLLIAAGLVGYAVSSSQQSADAGKLVVPSAAVDDGTAFAVGSGPVVVDLYEDFMCPVCQVFESQSSAALRELAAKNEITLRHHPVAILDRASEGTEYSSRAAGAAAAAGQAGKFVEYHDVLYANQPAENTPGLSDDKLIELGRTVGLTDAAFADAVKNKTYVPWAAKATDTFSARGHTGTPTIVVDGKQVTGANNSLPTTADVTRAIGAAKG
ncbi:protein-disulfide isomerase [Krasilnikovia cinnamomea]|uniref:Protein-disulfide isomerase n=1 Tax=Krasilnikovia cinnamomea TaxID=349313 RepID=A0A4Q7ZMR8_9ACTN|nr:thioredoxin domain-containing protein [Krasilnikovia cinnamomea]RZU52307.1 protein-disulfide isomerase [Krasilnikovia cinnamomea]